MLPSRSVRIHAEYLLYGMTKSLHPLSLDEVSRTLIGNINQGFHSRLSNRCDEKGTTIKESFSAYHFTSWLPSSDNSTGTWSPYSYQALRNANFIDHDSSGVLCTPVKGSEYTSQVTVGLCRFAYVFGAGNDTNWASSRVLIGSRIMNRVLGINHE